MSILQCCRVRRRHFGLRNTWRKIAPPLPFIPPIFYDAKATTLIQMGPIGHPLYFTTTCHLRNSSSPSSDRSQLSKELSQTSAYNMALIHRNYESIQSQSNLTSQKSELARIEALLAQEDGALWTSDPTRAIALEKQKSTLSNAIQAVQELETRLHEARDMLKLAQDEQDPELWVEVSRDLDHLRADMETHALRLLMNEEADPSHAYIEIRSGAGGAESCDWVSMLSKMYCKWAADRGPEFSVRVVDEVKGDTAGLKSCTLEINGPYAYGYTQYEAGIHRFVRISPFDSNGKRHTSFVSVQVFPCVTEDMGLAKDIALPAGDLKVETMRSQGAGGQHVNKTESAIRITHLPSGIVVACQNQRSQHQNRASALQMLRSKLWERQARQKAAFKGAAHASLAKNEWGSQIRSYVLQPYQMIKDIRSGIERADVQAVLNGDIHSLLEGNLVYFRRRASSVGSIGEESEATRPSV